MAKFNAKKTVETQKTTNLAGGEAYKESNKLELVSILLTSFAQNSFYEKESQTSDRLIDLINKTNPEFVAKSAIFARNEFGMRSISHITAAELAKNLSNVTWAKKFYKKIVRRPDDMMEILSYYTGKGNTITNSMKKGFAEAITTFDAYQLGKYRGEGKQFKLIDIVNLVHPIPTEGDKFMVDVDRNEYINIMKKKLEVAKKRKNNNKNISSIKEKLDWAEKQEGETIKIHSLEALVIDLLRSKGTWESELTKAGQTATNKEEKEAFKRDAWKQLLNDRKIGYFALLRNLRNIIEQAPEMVDKACELLTDEKLIKKSLVLPFRFTTAFDEIENLHTGDSQNVRKVMKAINQAIEIALVNVPKFDGKTLVVIDVSGSMGGRVSKIASLFGAVLAKSNDCDTLIFDTHSRYINVNTSDSVTTISRSLSFHGGGTDFKCIFPRLNKAYDRIVILSDMQGWVGYYTPTQVFKEYCRNYNCQPHVYSFDLAGYGTLQFPENKVYALAGFSDKIFDIMKLLEQDRQALIHKIEAVEI